MVSRIIKTAFQTFATCIVLSLMLLPAQCLADEYEIEIAPKVINLQCGGNDLSVHTNIPCGDVNVPVCLSIEDCIDPCDEVCSDRSTCDNRGNFVGKFEVEEVVSGLSLGVGSYGLVLSGTLGIDEVPFTAAQESDMECGNEKGEDTCAIVREEVKIIDNPNSCVSDGENKLTKRIKQFLQCMQEE